MGLSKARAPSARLAKVRAAAKNTRNTAKGKAAEVEAKSRESGGYGRAVVSIWDAPAGGIVNSPAYRKVLARCGGVQIAPKNRAGAPVKGGYPISKYPPNVLVDGQRSHWVPDEWAQVVKNTGPGGTYIGWMSPEGKFFYHRHGYPGAVQETLGRPLTALDGANGIERTVRAMGVSANADKAFLKAALTPVERKHILDKSNFHFGVVSARRAKSDQGIYNIMTVEMHFRIAGVQPTWYVDAASVEDYKALGLTAVVGGKLTSARNMALDHAQISGCVCVQVSDDIAKWHYYDVAKQDLRGEKSFTKANAMLAGTREHIITPLAAAQFMLAKMRASPEEQKPKLAGVFPTNNASMTLGLEEFSKHHFILGDFFVADNSPVRFDETMTLKEDYDYTCSHIYKHGSVLRCNRMMVQARHSTNEGGAVATRDKSGSKEQENIAVLQKKWPGVFKGNKKRPNEILMNWRNYGVEDSMKKPNKAGVEKHSKHLPNKADVKKPGVKRSILKKVTGELKRKRACPVRLCVKVESTGKASTASYIMDRCKKCDGLTVEQCFNMDVLDRDGKARKYMLSDLRYDMNAGRLKMKDA